MTTASPDAQNEQRLIETEQVKAYFAGVGDMLLAGALIFTLLTFAVYQHLPKWSWAPALFSLYALTLIRLWLVQQYRTRPQRRSAVQWARTQLFTAATSGLIWGLGSAAMLPHLPLELQLLVFTVVSVVAASAIAESVSLLPPPRAFLVAAIAPLLLWSLSVGDKLHATLALMMTIFIVLMLRLGEKHGLLFIEQQKLRFRNESLAQELARQRDAAEQSHQSKTRFLAAASHDLRQPMHALAILLELLGTELEHSDRGRSLLARARLAADAMNGLLDTLLNISKLDAGVVKPERRVFAVQALLDEMAQEFRPPAEDKGLRFDVVRCSAHIDSDPTLLAQIVRNLLGNALRYTSAGHIRLDCRSGDGMLDIEVSDTGIGIAADQHEAIFTEFYQVGNKERNRREGLGLGLAIVSRVARILDHRVSLRSTPGHGSAFRVAVPLAESATDAALAEVEPEIAAPTADLAGRLIVMIDDEEDIRLAMQPLLQAWGCGAIVADSAGAAIDRIEAMKGRVDAVISDLGLGGQGNGIGAIAMLRRRYGDALPALLITGDTSAAAAQAAREARLAMLYKPISPERLRAALSSLIAVS